ncbi:MAG: PilZ domain-containing protein [Thermoleophilia bacterium]|jgi:c-di-GMP-binding flagellar brake protein YcgR|nr:PilZ domain-containing protein [Thermoleophilia bacterium]
MSETPEGTERRAHPRHRVSLPARVVAGEETAEASTLDLSAGGVLLGGDDFPSGTQVRIEIELAEMGWHAIDAEVVRTQAGEGGGTHLAARFAEIATLGGREAIHAFLEARAAERDAG